MNFLDRVRNRVDAINAGDRNAVRGKAFTMPLSWSDGSRVSLAAYGGTSRLQEFPGVDFERHVVDLFQRSPIVFSCIAIRARVFSQARFMFQQMLDSRPGPLFGDTGLRLLERPWPHGTTGQLLSQAEVDSSVSGNFFATVADSEGRIGRQANREDPELFLTRLRPDWVTMVVQSPDEENPYHPAARVGGLVYKMPGGARPITMARNEFIHYAPIPDPVARWKGMSWLTPVVADANADKAYTMHAYAFLKNGATPNLVVNLGEDIEPDEFNAFVKQFREDYEGTDNAYKTLFLAGGADVRPVSADFQQLDIKGNQGKTETRIASAGGVPPSLAGLTEGLMGSTLNTGNFGAARRLFVDATIRDLWAKFSASAETLVVPRRTATGQTVRLWYDARDIPFLREDAGDEAKTFLAQMQAVEVGIRSGFKPDAIVRAAKQADVGLLVGEHTGLVSVQLQEPGSNPNGNANPADEPTSGTNGSMPTLNGNNGRALLTR